MKQLVVRRLVGFHVGRHSVSDIGSPYGISGFDQLCQECRSAVPQKRVEELMWTRRRWRPV
jgi:hypothetical protein